MRERPVLAAKRRELGGLRGRSVSFDDRDARGLSRITVTWSTFSFDGDERNASDRCPSCHAIRAYCDA
jgi:hypothetical protein